MKVSNGNLYGLLLAFGSSASYVCSLSINQLSYSSSPSRPALPDPSEAKDLRNCPISHAEARQAILGLFQANEAYYYSDIAERLNLSLEQVVAVCDELERDGCIGEKPHSPPAPNE